MARGDRSDGGSQLWSEASRIPAALEATLAAGDGFEETLAFLRRSGSRRVVAVGNGASYYAALTLWLAYVQSRRAPLDVVALPAGLVADGSYRHRRGDVLLAISGSGELRDLVETLANGSGRAPFALITAHGESTLAGASAARALVRVLDHTSVTHTQSYCGSTSVALALWAALTRESRLGRAIARLPETLERALAHAAPWAADAASVLKAPRAAVVFGSGPAWAAALEASLLLKEVAGIPAEGCETREGGTSGMYALGSADLALSIPVPGDALIVEAEESCRHRGATVVRLPGGTNLDTRLAPVATFPAALALAIELATRAGLDVDAPEWQTLYEQTARTASARTRARSVPTGS
jgi:fructoselysine-6-P-deglycase FrlB-like protein